MRKFAFIAAILFSMPAFAQFESTGGGCALCLKTTGGTVTGALTVSGTAASLTVGDQSTNGNTSKITWLGKSSGGTALSSWWTMKANAYFSLDAAAGTKTDAIRVDSTTGKVAFTQGLEADSTWNGKLAIGATALVDDASGSLVVNRNPSTATGNHHFVRVVATDGTLAAGAGVNMYDAQAIISSTANIDHMADYQARSSRTGTGTMNDWFGFFTNPVMSSAGTTTRVTHLDINTVAGGGTVTTQYGVHVHPLANAGTSWAFYTDSDASFLGGMIQADLNAVTAGTMTRTKSANVTKVTHRFDWTNAMVVALGAGSAGDIAVCTLPAKTVVTNAYVIINTPDTSANALTVAVGTVAAGYIDLIVAKDAKAVANTVYGSATADRGTNLTGYFLSSFTGTTVVNAHFIKTTTALSTVLGSTGTVYIETMTLP